MSERRLLPMMSGALVSLEEQDGEPSAALPHIEFDSALDNLVRDGDDDDLNSIYDIESGEYEHGSSIDASLWSSSPLYPSGPGDSTGVVSACWDFLGVITAVCEAYGSGNYLKMMMLNARQWEPLGEGTTFRVSRSEVQLTTFSSRDHRRKEIIANRLVIKRNDHCGDMTVAQARGFIKELRVLHHMNSHPYIVGLRGVGWFEETLDENMRSFKPALILEEAFDTLQHLIGPDASVSHGIMLEIFGQITSGLRGLHSCGIAHGDLKPGNILLFKEQVVREGVQIESFIARLSDFESVAHQVDVGSFVFPPGTPGYRAPEVDEAFFGSGSYRVTFTDLVQADAWSLGIIFAVMLCGSLRSLQADTPLERIRQLFKTAKKKLDASTTESEHATGALSALNFTIRMKPADRDLEAVELLLAPFLRAASANYWDHPGPLRLDPEDRLCINHESLKVMAGPFRDRLSAELELISGKKDDPRRPKALWELSVLSISRFANPDASIDRGLSYALQAAQEGNICAKAFCYRFYEAFGRVCPCSPQTILSYLKEAAAAGHQWALANLRERDPSAAVTVQAAIAQASLEPGGSSGNSPLHMAAALGKEEEILVLLAAPDCQINVKNKEGDTPLLLACRYGQPGTAGLLLDKCASAKPRNNYGENALHYVWCFDHQDGSVIARRLVEHGASVHDISRRRVPASELDIFPVLSGTPIERAAGRVRCDLVLVLLDLGSVQKPSNGRLSRRLLLWALRLHDIDLVEVLLESVIFDPSRFDSGLLSIMKTKWLHRGEERTLLDAACCGWVADAGAGCHYPLRAWLVMRHGGHWRRTIFNSISMLEKFSGVEKTDIDASIRWAFQESLYDAFITLLRCKFELESLRETQPHLTLLDRWVWRVEAFNADVLPPQEVYLIDRIFYDPAHGGTLAQQSLVSGDRYMLRLLCRKLRANAALPTPVLADDISLDNDAVKLPLTKQMNLYSLLSYTNHRDLWFADELRRLCVPIFCPWDTRPFELDENPIALWHALGTGSEAYLLWLLRHGGVSVMDPISTRHNLLQAVMRSRSRRLIKFFFNGLNHHDGGAALLPPQYSTDGGSEVLRLFFEANVEGPETTPLLLLLLQGLAGKYRRWDLLNSADEFWEWDKVINENQEAQPVRILSCYYHLLSAYPDARVPLQRSFFEVFIEHVTPRGIDSAKRDDRVEKLTASIIREHALRFSRHRRSSVSHRKFSPYLVGSPADHLAAEDVAAVMSIIPGQDLNCFSPSLFWFPFRSIWLLILPNALLTIFLWLFQKMIVYVVSTNIWNVGATDDYSRRGVNVWVWVLYLLCVRLFVFALPRFVIRVILTTLMLASFYLVWLSVSSVGRGISSLTQLRKFGSLNRLFLILAMSLALSSTLLLFLCIPVGSLSFLIKQEAGFSLVPYIL